MRFKDYLSEQHTDQRAASTTGELDVKLTPMGVKKVKWVVDQRPYERNTKFVIYHGDSEEMQFLANERAEAILRKLDYKVLSMATFKDTTTIIASEK